MVDEPALLYVTSQWGAPTQTFVRREADAVAAAGVEVAMLSLKRPRNRSGDNCAWLNPIQVGVGLARAIARHPLRCSSAFASVRKASWRNVPAMLAATAIGLAWSGNGLVNRHLHSHFGWVSGAAARAASLHAGVSYSIVYHAFEIHTARYVDPFAAWVAADARQTFTVSVQDSLHLRDLFKVQPDVLRMGVTQEWMGDTVPPRQQGHQVISVGSLVPKKGHRDLVTAMASLPREWELTILGEGPDRDTLKALIDELGLEGRVTLAGLQSEDEIKDHLLSSNVFALACVELGDGDRDGIPVAIIEAMALELPVVTTDAGAIAELVEGAAIVVGQREPDQLRDALLRLGDEQLRTELGRRGRQRVHASWTVSSSAQKVAELAYATAAT